MMLTFLFISVVLSCTTPVTIPEKISKSYSYEETHDLERNGVDTKWSCQQVDTEIHTNRAITFAFTVSQKMQVEVSTCYGSTNFASRIIIGSECNDGVISHCVGATDGDPNGQCDGHRSKLIMDAQSGVTYYAMVMGLTNDDMGQFHFTVKAYENPTCYYCNEAQEIKTFPTSVGATVTSGMSFIGNIHGLKRGFWFTFTATKTEHVIDTCNKNTQYPTTIYLYQNVTTSKRCMSDMPIVEAVDGCGSFARLYYDKFVIGQKYYVFVSFTDDTTSNPVVGSLEITFRTNGGENYKCPNAFSITKKPFNIQMDMRGYTKNVSPCHLDEEKYGMYFSVRGDGRRYVFHTCFTGSTGNDHTYLEMYEGECGGCTIADADVCGNDAMITRVLENDVLYRFRVVTTNPEKKVAIGLMQIDTKDNYECKHAKVMNMTDNGDQYIQYLIGSNQETPTEFDCKDNHKDLLGGWYKYTAEKEDITIMHGVYSFKVAEFKGYLATLDSCTNCLSSNFDKFIATNLQVPKGETRYVFATTIRQEGVGKKYGTFMYWAVKSENKGGSYKDPYEVEAPFTGIFAVGTHQLTIECDHSIPNLNTFPAIALRYKQPAEKTYTISTCGSETVVSTMIEIAKETKEGSGIYDCYATNDINDCGFGSTITTSGEDTYYALVGINPHSSESKSVLRFNLYVDEKEESSQCKYAEKIESIPSTYYSYTTKASPSRGKCGILSDGLKGKWFTYKPTQDEKISIITDDVSTFNTQVGVYTSCSSLDDVSIPGECVKGTDTYKTPVGQHGTHLNVDLEADQTYYIFVGGATNSESGMMRVKFTEYKPYHADEEDDGLTGGQIFGIIVAVFILIALLVGIGLFIAYYIYKNHHATESRFNTF